MHIESIGGSSTISEKSGLPSKKLKTHKHLLQYRVLDEQPQLVCRYRSEQCRWREAFMDVSFFVVIPMLECLFQYIFLNAQPATFLHARTKLLKPEDAPSLGTLRKLIPRASSGFGMPDLFDWLEGSTKKQSSTTIHVRVVSAGASQAELIAGVFSCIPCHVQVLNASDFFSNDEMGNENNSVNHLAVLRGAIERFPSARPMLVFDSDTALSCSSIGSDGSLKGTTVVPGVRSMLQGLEGNVTTDVTPAIMRRHMESKTFATGTSNSAVRGIVKMISTTGRLLIQQWVKEEEYENTDYPMNIVITGEEADLVHTLISAENKFFSNTFKLPANCKVTKDMGGLDHEGIRAVLQRDISYL